MIAKLSTNAETVYSMVMSINALFFVILFMCVKII
jgi:hypothetical protein